MKGVYNKIVIDGELDPKSAPPSRLIDHNDGPIDSYFHVKSYRTFQTRYIWTIPLICALLFPFCCISMYGVAVSYGHVELIFPYISDMGALPPESGLFAQMMNFWAILVVCTASIRYYQLKFYIDSVVEGGQAELIKMRRLYHFNLYSLLTIFPGAAGLMMVGNFRSTELPLLHLIGSILISSIIIGVFFQIRVCRPLSARYDIESSPTSMSIMLILGFSATVLTLIFIVLSYYFAGFENAFNTTFGLHWTEDKPGYKWHLLTTVSEWIAMQICIPFYFLCLCKRMKHFQQWDQIWRL